jgi:hypothetical protein
MTVEQTFPNELQEYGSTEGFQGLNQIWLLRLKSCNNREFRFARM